jgi:pilus assembly protein CpaE
MVKSKHAVVIVGAKGEETIIRQQIGDLAEVMGAEPNPAKALDVIREKGPSIALLYLDHESEAILSLSKQLAQGRLCTVIIITKSQEPNNILLAMRSGATDVAFLEESNADIRRAIDSIALARSPDSESPRCKVVSIFSAKGGSGATTIASNFAGALLTQGLEPGEEKRKVALLDFDLEMGDILVFLDIESRFSYLDVVRNRSRLDAELLFRSLAQHSSGLYVLSQADQPESVEEVGLAEMTEVVGFLRQHFDYLVIDGLRDFRDIGLLALDNSDTIVLTMTQDIPALKNADRCLRVFKRLGYSEANTKLVLNRYQPSKTFNTDSVSDALGHVVNGTVANDFPMVVEAINKGQLLVESVPGSKVAKDLVVLTELVFGRALEKKRRRFFSWGRQ